jgi:hypothetical protein
MERLTAIHRYSRRLHCYLCGESGEITKDHAAPQRWVYPRGLGAPGNWPTAPLCQRCKEETDPADTQLHRYICEAGGSESPAWKAYVAALPRQPNLLSDLINATHAVQNVDGEGWTILGARQAAPVEKAVRKLVAALHWTVNGARLPSEIELVMRISPRVPLPDLHGDLRVRRWSFGDHFTCAVGDSRFGSCWQISYFGSVTSARRTSIHVA